MRLEVIRRTEPGKTVNQNQRPAEFCLPVGLKARDLHHGPAKILITARRHIVEVLAKVTVVGVDDQVGSWYVRRRNRPLEEMTLHEAGSGIRAADGQAAKRPEDAVGVRIMIHETEAHERAQLGGGVVAELRVILPAPLVVGRRSDIVPGQAERPAAFRVGGPAPEILPGNGVRPVPSGFPVRGS